MMKRNIYLVIVTLFLSLSAGGKGERRSHYAVNGETSHPGICRELSV